MLGSEKGMDRGAQGWVVAEGTQRAGARALGDREAQGIPLGTRGTLRVLEQQLGNEQKSSAKRWRNSSYGPAVYAAKDSASPKYYRTQIAGPSATSPCSTGVTTVRSS
jgi:hypothetical protein